MTSRPDAQTQLASIRDLMIDGEWRTLVEIEAQTGAPHSLISAQLRKLRHPRHGSWEMLKRVRPNTDSRREYRLISSDHPQAVEMRESRLAVQASRKDFGAWKDALRELLIAVAAVNMEDAEGDALIERPVVAPSEPDDVQGPVTVSRSAMRELLRLGWWLRAKTEG